MIKTAGTWDRADWPVYFCAANLETLSHAAPLYKSLLIAVNEVNAKNLQSVNALMSTNEILVDSGVYWLSTQHAAKHGMSMNEALNLDPEKVAGFEDLFSRYCALMKASGDRAWGYIEIDQGGRENKCKTRKKLERLGLRPIPVYHPINDGWDYFDYLAQRYDRICFGNVVMAGSDARKKLIATAWERRRKYPNLWIHMLGFHPSELTVAFPMNSCDSSSWIAGVRWGKPRTSVASIPLKLGKEFAHRNGADLHASDGHVKASHLAAYDSAVLTRTMKRIASDQRKLLGCDIGLFK